MTDNSELLYIALLGKQRNVEDLGKKKFQKLVYLIETLGDFDLGYTYQIHLYGPFSKKLDDDLRQLSSEDLVSYAQRGNSYLLNITVNGESFLKDKSPEFHSRLSSIDKLFDEFCFRTPRDLELLTTSCFAYHRLGESADFDALRNCVQRIKGTKFESDSIDESVNEAMRLMRRLTA